MKSSEDNGKDKKSGKIDINTLKVSPQFEESGGVRQVVVRVPTRKPNKNEFVRVHPSDDYSMRVALLEDAETRDNYVIKGELADQFPDLIRYVKIVAAIGRHGNPFLQPLKLQLGDRRGCGWNESAMKAAELAKHKWIRIVADMSAGAYQVFEATGNIPEPEWPDLSFDDLVNLAFDGYVINDPNHKLIQKLMGKI